MQEQTTLMVKVKMKLEKFDGEHVEGDGKVPVEVIETEELVPLSEVKKWL